MNGPKCNSRRWGAGAEPGPPRHHAREDAAERVGGFSLCFGDRISIHPRPRRAARGAMTDWASNSKGRRLFGLSPAYQTGTFNISQTLLGYW